MTDKKILKEEELEKVSGGVLIGDERIFQCDSCGENFNPDTAVKGRVVENTDGKSSGELVQLYYCPRCGKETTYKVIQVLKEDLEIKFDGARI